MLEHVNEALGESPIPASKWPALQSVLGVDLLARLLNISTASVRGYLSGNRTPDDVALRLHTLALMVGDLAGAYNDVGIRRWFARPRTVLGNRAPVEVLMPGWLPDDPEPRQVRVWRTLSRHRSPRDHDRFRHADPRYLPAMAAASLLHFETLAGAD